MENSDPYFKLQRELNEAIDQKSKTGEAKNYLNLNWNHLSPAIRANQLVSILGQPDRIDPSPQGVVIWYDVDPFFRTQPSEGPFFPTRIPVEGNKKYSELMIKDEEVPHIIPLPHSDFFYVKMKINIPDDRVDLVRRMTESVGYDTMKKELYARCHFMPTNIVNLYLAKRIATKNISLEHAMQEYTILIPILAKEDDDGFGLMTKTNGMIGKFHQALINYIFEI